MTARPATDVARRCLCLELLSQRLVLETDADEPAPAREKARAMWMGRLVDLGVSEAFVPGERALLERPVGALSEDETDDLHGRAAGAAVLLWALGRVAERSTYATSEEEIAMHGLLGDGSVSQARAAADGATLRPDAELESALAAYDRRRGKAKEPTDPEQIYAGIAAHHLEWVLDASAPFDSDD